MGRDGEVPQGQEPGPGSVWVRGTTQPGGGWKHRLWGAVGLQELVGHQGSPGIIRTQTVMFVGGRNKVSPGSD